MPAMHIHILGICGTFMGGLAALAREAGHRVTGCDAGVYPPMSDQLRALGIELIEGWGADQLALKPDLFVIGNVVSRGNALMEAILDAGAPYTSGPQWLAEHVLQGRHVLAVAGTHGKTTTTSFIAQMLAAAGREPGVCIGGEVRPLGGCAGAGCGDTLVVEADESDGTLALYAPDFAVVTNIEFDHMEHFASVEAFENVFRAFAARTRRAVIYCSDDPRARRVCRESPRAIAYGFGEAADVQAADAAFADGGLAFTLVRGGQPLTRLTVPVPGRHNVLNALAAAVLGLELGLTPEQVRAALARVELPRRRFDRLADRDGVLVISDYAHHPTEVAALVRTARQVETRRTLAVFQPHRYTRTLALGAEFPAAFEGLDEVVLAPVYAASEKPMAGGSVWDLYAHFRAQGRGPVAVASSLPNAWAHLRRRLCAGDRLLVIGAGDVETVAFRARDELAANGLARLDPQVGWQAELAGLGLRATAIHADAPLGPRTTFGVGGTADLLLEVGDEPDLAAVLAWASRANVPFGVLGGGSNVLVSDLGVRGTVARLTGPAFRACAARDGLVQAGGATPLARLCEVAREAGLAGFEFLHGIPGTVGGAIAGNAGAWGQDIGSRVAWVRVRRPDGSESRLDRGALGFGYRSCAGLGGGVIVEAAFEGRPAAAAAIAAAEGAIAERRAWWRGLRCAGSVFRNPPGDFAGRLLEAAGLKGRRVGGARILERHANVIAVEEGAQAADVQALLAHAAEAVQRTAGVTLQPELILLE
jgi:UDP-N-acetylmuramate--L-alanine ligase/UDP-N-acetylenolpyruvoylglucosamine reductase